MPAICCTLRAEKAHSVQGNSCRTDCNSVRPNRLDVGGVSVQAWSQLGLSLEGKNGGNTFPIGPACQENRVNVRWIVSAAAGALSDDDHGRPNWKLCIGPVYIIRMDHLWQPIPLKDYWFWSGTADTKNQSFFISYKWYQAEQRILKMGYQPTLKMGFCTSEPSREVGMASWFKFQWGREKQ
jgi:hypothetical protein